MKALKIIAIILAVICALLVPTAIVFKTHKRLDYSDVPELHEAGRRLGRIEYYSDNGGEYDCWYYINEYLKEKNYEKRN